MARSYSMASHAQSILMHTIVLLQADEGRWVARSKLREKLLPRLEDRPLVEFVLNIAPNKLTSRGAVFRWVVPL